MSLEGIVNLGKGFVRGITGALDPVGEAITVADWQITGAGSSNRERAVPTFTNRVYQQLYDPKEEVKFWSGYVPRAVGTVAGGVGTAVGIAGLYLAVGPVALAGAALLGTYSVLGSLGRYAVDFVRGEKIGNRREKSSFRDGFIYGYHRMSHLVLAPILHGVESDLTGRGIDDSNVRSSIRDSSAGMRRNFSGILGSAFGGLWGVVVSIGTLGLLPLYKDIRTAVKTFGSGHRERRYGPSYVSAV